MERELTKHIRKKGYIRKCKMAINDGTIDFTELWQ